MFQNCARKDKTSKVRLVYKGLDSQWNLFANYVLDCQLGTGILNKNTA